MPQVQTEEFSFLSNDSQSTCQGRIWAPQDEDPRALIQICHGMCEHIGAYDYSARKLVEQGFLVYGIDHIGHGKTQPNPELRGIFDPQEGANHIIEDQHSCREFMQKRYPATPLVFLGHSMGSFIARNYIARHGEGLAAAIIMGTNWMNKILIHALGGLTSLIALSKGWDYRSKLVDSMGTGGYNKEFDGTGANTGYEWLSRDPKKALAYRDDPDCGFVFSVSGYHMLSQLLDECTDKKKIAQIPKDLPVLVISGGDDPVGEKGAGPRKAYQVLSAAGLEDVTLQIYEGARHEPLNETNKDEVISYLGEWILNHAKVGV